MTSPSSYDHALALASLVRTKPDRYLAVRCSCGASPVIWLRQMAEDRALAHFTLAHIAIAIKGAIREKTGLTASAGVSYNKLLAKSPSDHHKSDGLS